MIIIGPGIQEHKAGLYVNIRKKGWEYIGFRPPPE
jgi:hypothetical protein